ncbi:MAG: penicillin-binding protein [Syntrophobacteraceae bacterium]
MERRSSANFLNARYWSCSVLLQIFVISGFCLILYKAFRLQVIEHSVWVQRERDQTETSFKVPSYRGSVYDRQGRLLSYSVPQYSLYADSGQVDNPKLTAAKLARALGMSEEVLTKKLSRRTRFVWIKRHLSDQQAVAVENLRARGLNLVAEYKRFYPLRQVAGQVIGFVGLDGAGLEGIEKGFDQLLRHDEKTVGRFRDAKRRSLWLEDSPPPEPTESNGLRLALDAFVQYISECELEKTVSKYNARSGEVVVIDTQTSEVLAMANWPQFDPNLADKKDADSWRNKTITDYFEPGSTFKVFLVSAALEEGTVRERDRIYCENGKCRLAGHTINDVHPYGWLTLPEVIKHSSNIAASKVALQLGAERFERYIRLFGFGSLTEVNLPGEAKGAVRPWKRWRPIDLATTGFGQSIGVTSLQLTQAIACIANQGEYFHPIIAKEVVDSEAKAVRQFEVKPSHRVIQKKTAEIVRGMMKGVTEEGGTGVNAAPDGYTVAGKTGTAQVLDPVTKRYASSKFTSLFTGFIPADQPRLAITVAIHEPHGAIYGGVVAAPVFKNIAGKVLPYLGVAPSFKAAPPPVEFRLANAARYEIPKATAAPTESNQDEMVMPDISGLSLKKAIEQLVPFGVQTKFRGSGKVVGQYPQAGSPLSPNAVVELLLDDSYARGSTQ